MLPLRWEGHLEIAMTVDELIEMLRNFPQTAIVLPIGEIDQVEDLSVIVGIDKFRLGTDPVNLPWQPLCNREKPE